ncbi:MAG: hypothetical protein KatS3mg089_0657 [Patescibacteria group bacterium]|nr:MAG: hypothetical protein KatS3mg089_0657 [Patescibacteria group bacterium]
MRFIKPSLILFLFFIFVYTLNLSDHVFGGDVGDFLYSIYNFTYPHPPGYPLYTLLGILFSFFPLSQSFTWKVGLISAVSSALAVVVFYKISYFLTKNTLIGFISALILGTYSTFWLYAELSEVFAMHSFFLLLLLYITLLYQKYKTTRLFYLLCFVGGLTLAHHLVIVLLFPSLALLVFYKNLSLLRQFKVILRGVLFALIGLLPYLYIPFASFFGGETLWTKVNSIESFIRYILRLDYGYMPGAIDTINRFLSLKQYVFDIFVELTPPVIFFVLLGLISLILRKHYLLFFSFLLAIFLFGPFFVMYVSTPMYSSFQHGVIERFYQNSAILLLLLFPIGFLEFITIINAFILSRLPEKSRIKSYNLAIITLFGIIPLTLFINNFPKTNLRGIMIGENLGRDIISNLPQKSVLFLYGDSIFFNTKFVQTAFHIREDVDIINLARLNTSQLLESEIKHAKKEYPKEKNPLVPALISMHKKREVFSLTEILSSEFKKKGYHWRPYGLVYQLVSPTQEMEKERYAKQQMRLLSNLNYKKKSDLTLAERNLTIAEFPVLYAVAYGFSGKYILLKYNDMELANLFYDKALAIHPEEKTSLVGKGTYFLAKRDCAKALSAFQTVVAGDPAYAQGYVLLYVTYTSCVKNEKHAEDIARVYEQKFGKPLKEDVRALVQ